MDSLSLSCSSLDATKTTEKKSVKDSLHELRVSMSLLVVNKPKPGLSNPDIQS